jgi:acyl carrier protein
MSDLKSRLVTCFAAVFPGLSPEEIARANVNSVGSWDSMATLTLTGLIEEEFSVSIDPGDREDLTSFELILDHLRSQKGVS